jgi:hypothetical protein
MKNFIKSENAVSESLGFALTLGILIVSSALVYYGGVPILEKSEKTTHFQEMEKSFILLSQNIDKVALDRAPIRNTELKIKDGTMSVSHNSVITVGGFSYEIGSIEYTYDDRTVAYENGGVFTKYPGGEVVMVSKPRFSVGAVTTIPAIGLIGESWISGEGIIRIKSNSYSSSLQPVANGTVSLVIQSSYYKGWAEYLKVIGASNVSSDDAGKSVSSNITSSTVNVDSDEIIITMEN